MQKPFDQTTVLQLLNELRRKDPHRRIFGANGHDYRLYPPLAASAIEAIERALSVSFPNDYKVFILQVGNGGAGPFYGLFPFGQHDDSFGFCHWEEGGLVGDISRPFAHTGDWNLPDSFWQNQPDPPLGIAADEEERLIGAWDRQLEQYYWNPTLMDGAIPICHLGCALRQWLVITGEQRGLVWNDFRADNRGLSPVRDEAGHQMMFKDWYMAWLINSLRECN